MIALLSCSTNLLISSVAANSSTGGIPEDSLTISYDDLRKANSKLIELKYEKEINSNLRDIIYNDSIAISNYKIAIDRMDEQYSKQIKKVKKQRNVAGGIGIGAIILLIISIL
jgi:hypothetical protein